MCDPTVIGVTSAAMGTYSAIQKADAIGKAGAINAATMRANAGLADRAAGDARERGQYQEGQERLQTDRLQGQQKSGYAAGNVDVKSGSAMDVLSDTSMMGELGAKIQQNNYAREAWGFGKQAASQRRQADITEQTAANQAEGTIIGGIAGGALDASKFIHLG